MTLGAARGGTSRQGDTSFYLDLKHCGSNRSQEVQSSVDISLPNEIRHCSCTCDRGNTHASFLRSPTNPTTMSCRPNNPIVDSKGGAACALSQARRKLAFNSARSVLSNFIEFSFDCGGKTGWGPAASNPSRRAFIAFN